MGLWRLSRSTMSKALRDPSPRWWLASYRIGENRGYFSSHDEALSWNAVCWQRFWTSVPPLTSKASRSRQYFNLLWLWGLSPNSNTWTPSRALHLKINADRMQASLEHTDFRLLLTAAADKHEYQVPFCPIKHRGKYTLIPADQRPTPFTQSTYLHLEIRFVSEGCSPFSSWSIQFKLLFPITKTEIEMSVPKPFQLAVYSLFASFVEGLSLIGMLDESLPRR